MSSTLSEGVRVPDIGSTSWGADVNFNWGLLNTALANISGNVKVDVANTWTAPQTFTETISGSIDGVAARAVGDEDGNNIKTALASKAADADVVHLAGAETITGDKTWTGVQTFTDHGLTLNRTTIYDGTAPSSTTYYGWLTFTNAAGNNLIQHRGYVNTSNTNTLRYWVQPNKSTLTGVYGGFQVRAFSDGTTADFKVRGNFTPYDTAYGAQCGTTDEKWQAFNGINPGALGMIDTSTSVNIDTSGWASDGSTANRVYINGANPTFPGYLFIRASGSATDFLSVRLGGSMAQSPLWTAPYYPAADAQFHVIVPCPANSPIRVYTTVAPAVCKYFPCLGNV